MLKQKLILSYSTKLFFQILQIITSILIARLAGPTVLGILSYGLSMASLLSFVADLGFGTAHIKLISEGKNESLCIGTFSVIKFILILLYILIFITIIVVHQSLGLFESPIQKKVLIIFAINQILIEFSWIPMLTFNAKTEQAKQDIPELIRNFTNQTSRIFLVIAGFGAVALAYANLVSSILMLLVLFLFFIKYLVNLKYDKNLFKEYLKISVPVIIIGLSTKTYEYIDKILLQYFLGSEELGYYTAGYRIGSLILLLANTVGMLFMPLFSSAFTNNNKDYIIKIANKFIRFICIFILPLVGLISIISQDIITILLGKKYMSSISIMIIINFATFIKVLYSPFSTILVGSGKFKLSSYIYLINIVLFVCLGSVLANPKFADFGGFGMALAVLLSNIFLLFAFFYKAKQQLVHLSLNSTIIYLIVTVASYLIFHLFYSNIDGLIYKIIILILYMVVIYFLFFITGYMNKSDLFYLYEAINVNKVLKYIKQELFNK
jgi:O-antigen/teichoic acid export membrane protein